MGLKLTAKIPHEVTLVVLAVLGIVFLVWVSIQLDLLPERRACQEFNVLCPGIETKVDPAWGCQVYLPEYGWVRDDLANWYIREVCKP